MLCFHRQISILLQFIMFNKNQFGTRKFLFVPLPPHGTLKLGIHLYLVDDLLHSMS